MAEFNVRISQEQLERIRRDIVKAFTPKETPVTRHPETTWTDDLRAIREEAVSASNVLADIRDLIESNAQRDNDERSEQTATLHVIHDLLDERLTSNPGGRPGDLSAPETEPAPEGRCDPGAMRDSDLDAIRDRVDRNAYPEGDRARLLAEVDRLREGITSALSLSRDMQSDVRSSVTLAFLQDALCDLLYPTEGES